MSCRSSCEAARPGQPALPADSGLHESSSNWHLSMNPDPMHPVRAELRGHNKSHPLPYQFGFGTALVINRKRFSHTITYQPALSHSCQHPTHPRSPEPAEPNSASRLPNDGPPFVHMRLRARHMRLLALIRPVSAIPREDLYRGANFVERRECFLRKQLPRRVSISSRNELHAR